jgi:DNA repair exonuclease SbcCD ATPase subunit
MTSEGSGKSSIPNAIVWCLFGKLPKDSKIDDVITDGQKSCTVEVTFQDGTRVIRSRKPNDLTIYAAQGKTLKGKDQKDTQKLIETYLGMGFETFCQSVYFAQNYPNKFITANEQEKGKILSEIQDLSIFDKARKETTKYLNNVGSELSELKQKIETMDVYISGRVQSAEHLQSVKDTFDAEKEAELNALFQAKKEALSEKKKLTQKLQTEFNFTEDEITSLIKTKSSEVMETKLLIKEVDNLINTIERTSRLKADKESKSEKYAKKIKLLKAELKHTKEDGAECPTCGNDLNSGKVEKLTEWRNTKLEEIREYQELYKQNELELSEIELKSTEEYEQQRLEYRSKLSGQEEELNQIEKLRRQKDNLENRELARCEDTLASIQKQIEIVEKKNTKDITEKLRVITSELDKAESVKFELNSKYKETNELYDNLTTLKDSFKDVKSYVFQNLLVELNTKANFYLENLFNQSVNIKFTNESDSGEVSKITVMVTIDGIERPLGLYSGGQFRRIQLAVDLALSDIVSSRNQNVLNFMILDEVFKDLSEESMTRIIEFLPSLGKNIILIEHNSLVKTLANEKVTVELRDGISSMLESNYASTPIQMHNV